MGKEQSIFHSLVKDHRTVSLIGRITPDSCHQLIEQLLECQLASSTDSVKLIIESGGGDTGPALTVCDIITNVLTIPIEAIAIGRCSSAATFILLHCPVRRATPHTQFIIHSGRIGNIEFTMNQMTEKNLNDLLCETKTFVAAITELYAGKLGLSATEVQRLIDRGDQDFNNALTAEEALKIGLITEIVTGKVGIFPEIHS